MYVQFTRSYLIEYYTPGIENTKMAHVTQNKREQKASSGEDE